jgi:hypothetical protein
MNLRLFYLQNRESDLPRSCVFNVQSANAFSSSVEEKRNIGWNDDGETTNAAGPFDGRLSVLLSFDQIRSSLKLRALGHVSRFKTSTLYRVGTRKIFEEKRGRSESGTWSSREQHLTFRTWKKQSTLIIVTQSLNASNDRSTDYLSVATVGTGPCPLVLNC